MIQPRTHTSGDTRSLLRIVEAARRRFRSRAGLLGIGIGAKFKRGRGPQSAARKLSGKTCIQFFVAQKWKKPNPRQRLPGFLYHRFLNGRVDYRKKIPTDVIPVGCIQAACGAGSHLDSNRDHGLVTLIFRNRLQAGNPFYLLSCAHVAGDIHRSPPAYAELTIEGSSILPFARTLVNSTARDGGMDYDIALARIEPAALPLPELRIRDTDRALDSFLPLRSIRQGLGISAVLRNQTIRGTVDSLHVSADVRYGGENVRVHNLFGVNVGAGRGDSGGLIYQDTRAVGIIVAAARLGWLWFQPLQPAMDRLGRIAPFPISIFHAQPTPNL